jgi:arabinose-5-phosphate isomerase
MIQTAALRTLDIEIAALTALRDSINDVFEAFVQAVFTSKGRLVVTGIGKSAIVAQKIVATLNSTGTPALFLHAADAIHGDLGMVQANDIVLCLSKSGDTPEIKVLAPLIKNMGNRLAAMVANPSSYLAQQADFVLHTPIAHEADPNNLAPTASTTAQMAMGDAIAVALLSISGFKPEDFARFHPGGALGKQLYLRVRDLVLLHEKPAVRKQANITEIISEMTQKRLGATAVLCSRKLLKGIITDGDLRRMLAGNQNGTTDFGSLTAVDLMNPNFKKINANELAINALSIMREYNISQIIAVDDDNNYMGMVHIHDLIKEGLL